MKYWVILSALTLSLGVGACSSEEIISDESSMGTETGITEIAAVIGEIQYENNDSRTAVTMGEFNSSSIKLVWAEKDTIGIYPTEGDQLSFPIVEGIGTNKCTFNGGGWALKNSTSYKAYSPFNRAYYYHESDKLPVSMLGQKQVGNGNSDHLGKYDLQIAEGKTPETGKISFDFKHQVCFIRMDLTAPIAATWKSITLESDALFTTKATMNLSSETPSLAATSTAYSVTLDLENVNTKASETITAYMVVLPINLTNEPLDVKLTDIEGNTYTAEAIIANDFRNFKAGYARWIKAADFQLTGMTIHVSQAGTLQISNQTLTSLKITGELNGRDILHLRNYSGFDLGEGYKKHISYLEYLDLSESQILSGGGFYCYVPGTDGESTCCTNNNTIGQFMFYELTNLKHVILPKSITMIEEYAFHGCTNLRSVQISDNTTIIKDAAFYECTNLTHVSLSKNLTKIGLGAFQDCTSLNNVVLPESLTFIGLQAFMDCTSLRRVNIKATNPPNLGNLAFKDCNNELTIYVPTESLENYKKTMNWKNLNLLSE